MATGYSCFFLTSLEAARPCVLGLAHGRGRAGDQRSCSSVLRRPAATASWIWAAPIHAWHSAPAWRASSSSSTCGGAQGRALQLGLALHGRQQRPGVPAPCLPDRRAPARRHRSARWWDRRVRAELGACGIFSVAVDGANRLLWMGMGRQRQQISTAAASRSLRVTYILAPLDRLTPLASNPSTNRGKRKFTRGYIHASKLFKDIEVTTKFYKDT